MLSIYQAAYEGKLFIVQQMLEKEETLINSFDEVRNNLTSFNLGFPVKTIPYRMDVMLFIGQLQEDMQIL